jgi:hypothetical protein
MAQHADTPATIDRRSALRLLGSAALAAVAAGAAAGRAEAARTWCRTDPVVKIDGKVADIWLGSYTELHTAATGPAQIVVSVPKGVSTQLLACDLGFGKYGYTVNFKQDAALTRSATGPQVIVSVYVPSKDASLPLSVSFAPRSSGLAAASASGFVNRWVTLQTK